MENPNIQKQEGLPESAQDSKKKNPLVLLVIGILFTLGILYSFYHYFLKRNAAAIPQIEENYTPEVSLSEKTLTDKGKNTVVDNQKTSVKSTPEDPEILKERMAYIQQKQEALQKRISAPLLVVNASSGSSAPVSKSAAAVTNDPNSQFMDQVSAQSPDKVNATAMGSLHYLVTEGSLIHADLETTSNSDLPGYLRAEVSEPVYADDGSQVLIPAGSRLIGQYKSGTLQGQSRIFVVWTRLIIPSGISVNIGSPGVDNLGAAGMAADAIDRHFWQQFGSAILLSVIGAGAQNIGVSGSDQFNASQAYRIAAANSFAQTANQSLQQTGVIAPTLHINQGKEIMVFVVHDLDFRQAMRKAHPRLDIF